MEQKKQSKNWNIAATHYLTSGFAIPFVVGLILVFPLASFFPKGSFMFNFVAPLIGLISIWLGAWYSANYINRKYFISDSSKIVKASMAYFIILKLLYLIGTFPWKGIDNDYIQSVIISILGAIIFYSVSKKYIKTTIQ